MRIFTPRGLAYPITVTELHHHAGEDIEQNAHIFSYRYLALNNEYNKDTREYADVERTYYSQFESEVEGNITTLNIQIDQVINGRTLVAEIEEPCRHEVQFGGMCANCGRDMTTQQYNTTNPNTNRATVNTVHAHTALLVSREEAGKADEEAKRRLLDARKLSLVVDLDQTIIHATVDPTVAEWQKDVANPNHDAVKDVRAFQLVDDGPGRRSTWYYIKLRPGLKEFLEAVSQHYELHIYTMATRAYAENISRIVDPDRKLFGERILSRDENGSMNSKSLKRLFPVDTKMVVIIDDRGDVWSWSPNLIKVSPYDFFVGIGDINSSFLPKRPALEARPHKPTKLDRAAVADGSHSNLIEDRISLESSESTIIPPTSPSSAPTHNGAISAVDQMVTMAGSQDDGSMKEKAEEQDKTIAAQLEDRPLLKKQQILDTAEEEAKASPAVEVAADLLLENGDRGDESLSAPKYRHNLLQDDDDELQHLSKSLSNIHHTFFDEYDRGSSGLKGGRVAELRPGQTKKLSVDDLELIPDVAQVMADMKLKVLASVHMVFSGVIPIGVDVQSHDLALWARDFGATISESITKSTTHLIASPERRTAKVRQAAKRGGRIAIVDQNWLYACFSEMRHVEEGDYRIYSDTPANGTAGLPDSFENRDFVLSSSDEESALTEEEAEDGDAAAVAAAPDVGALELNTDLAELARYGPSTDRDDISPTEHEDPDNWMAIHDDMDEFLGTDWDDDTDTESDAESIHLNNNNNNNNNEDAAGPPRTPKKRKRAADVDGEGGIEEEGSRLQKRKNQALGRTTSLSQVATAVPSDDVAVASQNMDGSAPTTVQGVAEEDDDLEAALAAEMEKQFDGGELELEGS